MFWNNLEYHGKLLGLSGAFKNFFNILGFPSQVEKWTSFSKENIITVWVSEQSSVCSSAVSSRTYYCINRKQSYSLYKNIVFLCSRIFCQMCRPRSLFPWVNSVSWINNVGTTSCGSAEEQKHSSEKRKLIQFWKGFFKKAKCELMKEIEGNRTQIPV